MYDWIIEADIARLEQEQELAGSEARAGMLDQLLRHQRKALRQARASGGFARVAQHVD